MESSASGTRETLCSTKALGQQLLPPTEHGLPTAEIIIIILNLKFKD